MPWTSRAICSRSRTRKERRKKPSCMHAKAIWRTRLPPASSISAREIDAIQEFTLREPALQIFHNQFLFAIPGILGGPAYVRSNKYIIHFPQRAFRRKRFFHSHIESGARDHISLKRGDQRSLVEKGSAGDIDQIGRGLHQRDFALAEHVACFRCS